MEIGGARRKATQYRPFDLADMVEVAIDQSLTQVRCRLALIRRQACRWIELAHHNRRQIGDIQSPKIRRRVGRIRIACANVQGGRKE